MERIALRIFDIGMMAGIMVIAVIAMRVILGKMRVPAGIRLVLWGLVAVRLMIPFSIESRYSLMPNVDKVSDLITGISGGADYARQRSETTGKQSQSMEATGGPGVLTTAEPGTQKTAEQLVQGVTEPFSQGAAEPGAQTSADPSAKYDTANDTANAAVALFVRVWIAGMVLLFLYAGISSFALRRKVAVRIPYAADSISKYDAGGHDVGGRKAYLSDGTDTPFILGILRPEIYLPSSCRGESAVDLILAHEQAHIGNGDHLWKPLGFLLLSVYWFQPLLWVAYVLFCRDIEFACDERVIRRLDTDSVKQYMEVLLKCSTREVRFASCPLAFGEVGVKKRIKAVWNYKKPAFWIVMVGMTACVAVAVTMLTERKPEETKEGEISYTAELLKPWAEAFLDKDTEALAAHSVEDVQKQMQEALPLSFPAFTDTEYVWKVTDSYPWPQRAENYAAYEILPGGENRARIYYYAYDPDTLLMHVWVEDLEYEQKGSGFRVTNEQTVFHKQIMDASTALAEVWQGFDHTGLDYRNNGLGEELLARYRKHDRSFYERLSSPMSALCLFLHLDENSVQIAVTNLGDQMICDVKFPGYDAWGNPVSWQGPVVCMARYGADSGEAIWIPMNNPYTAEEIKERAGTMGRPENWPVICNVSAELTGDGVADEVSLHYDAGNESYDPSGIAPNPGDYVRRVTTLGGVVGAVVKDGATGEILFRQTYSAVHVGNGVLALVHRNGKDYLLTGQCDQAFGESVLYEANVFSWVKGEQVTADRYEGSFPIDRQEVLRGILREGEDYRFQNSKEVTAGLKELITKYEDGSRLLFASDNYLTELQTRDPLVQAVFVEDSGHSMQQYTLETYYQSVWNRYRCEYSVHYPEEKLYGRTVFSIEEIGNIFDHIITFYERETGEPLAQIWHNGGSQNGPYLMDLDHDGKNELISEVSWADGARDAVLFREQDGKIQFAYATDLIPEQMIPQMGGVGTTYAHYDPDTKRITTYCWDGDRKSNHYITQEYEIGAELLTQLEWNKWDSWSEY